MEFRPESTLPRSCGLRRDGLGRPRARRLSRGHRRPADHDHDDHTDRRDKPDKSEPRDEPNEVDGEPSHKVGASPATSRRRPRKPTIRIKAPIRIRPTIGRPTMPTITRQITPDDHE